MLKIFVLCSFLGVAASASALGVPMENLLASMAERSGMGANEVTVDQALQRVAVKMNLRLPAAVDKETRLDKLTAEAGKQLSYHYTLTALKGNEVNRAKFKNAMEPQLKRRLCDSDEMQGFLRNGVSVMYVYRAIDLQPVASFKYSPADCGYKK